MKSNIVGSIILCRVLFYSPLVNKDELAINGVTRDILSWFDADVSVHWLRDDVGVQTANGHQTAQVAAFIVGLVVLVQALLHGRPALQVAHAVDGAEAFAVGCGGRDMRFN